MSDSGRNPDLDAVARTDRFLDALAAAEPPVCSDPAEAALAGLLGGWRDELRWPPPTGLVSETEQAFERQAAATAPPASRRRVHRGMTLVGSAAATVLTLGGVGAVVGTAHPGGPLYGLRTMLLGEPASVHDERVELAAKTEFEKVQQMITEGQWDQAQERLTSVGDTVQTVNDNTRKQGLVDQWNRLNVQVQNRDPNAVPPPSSAPTTQIPAVTTAPTSVTVSSPSSSETPNTTAPTATTEPTSTTAPPSWSTTVAPSSSAPPGRAQQPPEETSTAGETTAPPTGASPTEPAPATGEAPGPPAP